MRKLLVIFAILFAFPAQAQDWPNCSVSSWAVSDRQPTADAQMRMRANRTCSTRNSNAPDMQLDVPPQNGTVAISDGRATYTPNRGFTGMDRFAFGWPRPNGRRRVHVSVEVR
jgi:Bacterial Ig domain